MNTPGCYYSVIRYMPDLARGEVLNVGLLLCCPERRFLGVETLKDFRHRPLPTVFPKADTRFLRHRLTELQALISENAPLSKRVVNLYALTGATLTESELFSPSVIRLFQATHCNDIQFGPLLQAAGEPQVLLSMLFMSLVAIPEHPTAYPTRNAIRRSFHNRLRDEKLLQFIQEDAWVGLDAVKERVDFTYENGRQHYLQAISLSAPSAHGLVQRYRQLARDVRDLSLNASSGDVEFFALLHSPQNRESLQMKKVLEADQIQLVDWQNTDELIVKIHADQRLHGASTSV